MADFEIRTDTTSLAEKRSARRQRKTTQWIITATVAACIAFTGLIVATQWKATEPPAEVPRDEQSNAAGKLTPPADAQKQIEVTEPQTAGTLVDDDGRTMWVSPTSGGPVDLRGLPPGCEMFVALRPADLLETGEGEKLLAALGPLGANASGYVQRTTGFDLSSIDRLIIGLRPARGFAIETTLVVTPRETASNARPMEVHWLDDKSFVVAPGTILTEIKELNGLAPPLRREVQSLIDTTDRDRHATIVVSPTFLFNDGRGMWQDSAARLRDPLFTLLPDSTRGAAVSLHAGDDFFAELRLIATIDQRPEQFAEQIAEHVGNWPAAVEREIARVQASPYSATVVARLPAMLRALDRYQRVGVDSGQAVLRVYLPAPAGHNLLLAGELLLAELMADGSGPSVVIASNSGSPRTIEQQLGRRTSLSFSRDTLETAVNQLADDTGIPMAILGSDLQLEGITKNQSFKLDEQNRTAGEILVAILRLANPDKTAASPADPKQKLVYTVGKRPDTGEPTVFITTRSQAEKRGDDLPPVFRE